MNSHPLTTPPPWFQHDYRSGGGKFRAGQMPSSASDADYSFVEWGSQKIDSSREIEPFDHPETRNKNSKPKKYSLVIVVPPVRTRDLDDGDESITMTTTRTDESGLSSIRTVGVQTDSGFCGSPSPPKSPTPDYDVIDCVTLSLSSESEMDHGHVDREIITQHQTKKVHFSSVDDDGDDAGRSGGGGAKSLWREMLVADWYRNKLGHCYRQEWVVDSKSFRHSKSPLQHPPVPQQPFGRQRSSRHESRRITRDAGSRTCSLDRSSAVGTTNRIRTPLMCDPDPLKAPRGSAKDWKTNKLMSGQISSSHKPVERASCGPGPPLKQLRSYSVDTQPTFGTPQAGRSRQRSVSGNVASKKTPVRRVDEEALKRSRLHSSQYELSQDLLDKQVEMLERKYGGVCARKAALTIQRAFRKYCIMKRFQDIANASKGEKRLSRRFPTFDLESKEWMVYNGNGSAAHHQHFHHHHQLSNALYDPENKVCGEIHSNAHSDAAMQSNFAALYRELSETLDGDDNSRLAKPCRTQSFRERRIKHDKYDRDIYAAEYGDTKDSYFDGYSSKQRVLDNTYYPDSYPAPIARSPPSFPRHPAWTAVPCSAPQRTHCPSTQGSPVYLNSSPSVNVQHPDNFQVARESVSSEDSALSSLSIGENESSEDTSLHRGTSTRHSLNMPSSPCKQHGDVLQRTPARASDVALGRRVASSRIDQKKVPPQVPKRTSSIPSREGRGQGDGAESQMSDGIPDGSQPSAQSAKLAANKSCPVEASPVWKRKSLVLAEQSGINAEDKRLSNISENSEDSMDGGGYSNTPPADMSHSFTVHNYPDVRTSHEMSGTSGGYKVTEIQRKRQYRVGLNLFNKKPERGVRYLIQRGFLEASPQAVARFLLTRKGLSKQMIGEYLGNLQNSFNMAVLECFVQELDLAGMQVDVALRKFQTFFRMPGEAQKIERLVEVFSHRYIDCNHDIASKFHNADTVFVLAFAIIMLNTDLHTPNMKAERRMKLDEFIRNLRSIDDGHDLDRDMLVGIYERIKTNEFKMGSDHVTQVLKVQQTIVGKKPNLALPHRRLVCYCRLYEVYDVSKKERPGVHQREVFLFNDMLMVTKIFSKKKNSVTYTFRQSFPLCGMSVTLFEAPYYPHGIRLSQRVDDKVLITFNARNEHDRSKFVEDLKESILEMDEMENLRIEAELEKQKMMRVRGTENRDSGVADMEIIPPTTKDGKLAPESASNNLKRSALSNSLLDLHEQQINKPVRRGSAGSLDSGMSISFQSSAASSVSHDSSPQIVHAGSTSSGSGSSLSSTRSATDSPGPSGTKPSPQPGFLGGLFGKKGKHASKSNVRKTADTSDV